MINFLKLPLELLFLITDDIDSLIQYLINLDLFGFITAIYVTRMGQVFYAFLMLFVTVTLYARTKNLAYLILVWLVVGGLGFAVSAPLISPLATLLTVLAITVLILKLYWRHH